MSIVYQNVFEIIGEMYKKLYICIPQFIIGITFLRVFTYIKIEFLFPKYIILYHYLQSKNDQCLSHLINWTTSCELYSRYLIHY